MSDILTLTFNPCVDKSTTVPSIIPEKKLRCTNPTFEPGGGGINVARAIKKLGSQSTAVYPAGGYSGKFLKTLLDREGVNSIVVETKTHTRENLIVFDQSANAQYRFGMPGSLLQEDEWRACLKELENAKGAKYIVVSGSLPPGVPPEIFIDIAAIAKKTGAKLIVDTSGDALKVAVRQGVYLTKPNINELATLTGKKELKKEEVLGAARTLIGEGRSEVLVVSLGEEGALLVTATESFQMVPPKVERKSTVGAGDSMVAGLVLSLAKGKPMKETLQYGIACGTAATMNPGTELCTLENVNTIFPMVKAV